MEALRNWLLSWGHHEPVETSCLCCGKCCESFGGNLRASRHDLKLWREAGRNDLLKRVNRLGWIWVDPENGRLVDPCPFLARTGPDEAHCSIHEIKPAMCRAYPTMAHSRRCLRGVFLKCLIASLASWTTELAALLCDSFCLI